MNANEIKKAARDEVAAERFRAAVEVEKSRLRLKRSLWDRLLPFTITIRRKA
jgi:hypothetical protein